MEEPIKDSVVLTRNPLIPDPVRVKAILKRAQEFVEKEFGDKPMKTTSGMTKKELLNELTDAGDLPIRVVRVDVTEDENLRIEGVEIINGEIVLIVDRHA